jgi:hypothetical protein
MRVNNTRVSLRSTRMFFWSLQKTTHAITPWIRRMAQRPSDHTKVHWKSFQEAKVTAFQSTMSGHLVQKRKTRNANIQFTWKLFLNEAKVHMYLVVHVNVGLNSRWVGYVTITLQLKNLRRKRSSTSRYDSPLSVLSMDYSFQRLTLYRLPPANWLTIRGWGRLLVQGADKRVKCSISHFLRAAVSCVETAHPSSLYVSIIWFSCKLGPLIWGIGACTLRAQCTSTSAVRRLRSLTGEQAGVGLSFVTFF